VAEWKERKAEHAVDPLLAHQLGGTKQGGAARPAPGRYVARVGSTVVACSTVVQHANRRVYLLYSPSL
jgi:hypothetical protein